MVNVRCKIDKKQVKLIKSLKSNSLVDKIKDLLYILRENPYQNPPPYEKLTNNLKGKYSRRINIKHRLVYEVLEENKIVNILSIWTHYEF